MYIINNSAPNIDPCGRRKKKFEKIFSSFFLKHFPKKKADPIVSDDVLFVKVMEVFFLLLEIWDKSNCNPNLYRHCLSSSPIAVLSIIRHNRDFN